MAAETTTSTVKEIKAVAKEMDNHPKNLETSKVAVIPQKSESSVHSSKRTGCSYDQRTNGTCC